MRTTWLAAFLLLSIASGQSEPDALNDRVLDVLRGYPLDGTHTYHWPREGDWLGTTSDVIYDGTLLCEGDPQGRAFCCGLTFEVYVRALRAEWGDEAPHVNPDLLRELQLRFFGDSEVGERRRLVQFGLESLGLGAAVAHEDARAGDFVQLWRHSGSGHSVIFINWVYRDDQIAGLTYWSTQTSTRGIGYRTEWFGPDGIDPAEVYVARAWRTPQPTE